MFWKVKLLITLSVDLRKQYKIIKTAVHDPFRIEKNRILIMFVFLSAGNKIPTEIYVINKIGQK